MNFRNSKRSTLRESLLSFNKKDPNRQILNLIPKPKKNSSNNFIFKIAITDFSLKAMKITNNGSIMYLALHKATGSVYTIKSIRKAAIKGRIN